MATYIYKELFSDRITLRRLKKDDAAVLFSLRSDPEVNKYIDRDPPKQIEDVLSFIEKINKGIDDKAAYYWVITLNESKELAGTFCIWNLSDNKETGEIGYELLPRFQKKGIMKEAISLVLNFVFDELQMKTIEAFTHKDNISSNKLLSSFEFELTDRKDPDNKDLLIYTLFKH